jgi:hypothetical protein
MRVCILQCKAEGPARPRGGDVVDERVAGENKGLCLGLGTCLEELSCVLCVCVCVCMCVCVCVCAKKDGELQYTQSMLISTCHVLFTRRSA